MKKVNTLNDLIAQSRFWRNRVNEVPVKTFAFEMAKLSFAVCNLKIAIITNVSRVKFFRV
jgi:hypothetical protein